MTWYRTPNGFGLALSKIRSKDHCCCTRACAKSSIICVRERNNRIYRCYICPQLLHRSIITREEIPSHLRPRLLAELDRHLRDDVGAVA